MRERRLTLRQYRNIDLLCFAAMLVVSEYVISAAAGKWFPGQPFVVSVTASLTSIVLMRWGAWAAFHAVLGGLVLCVSSGGIGQQYAIYCIGNLASLFSLFIIRWIGSERIRESSTLSLFFAASVQLLMQAGRALTAVVLGMRLSDCVVFFSTDSLSLLFTLLIIWIARRLDGIFEDQKTYLLRLQEADGSGERKKRRI